MADSRSPYVIHIDAVPKMDLGPPQDKLKGGALFGRMVFGADTSLMIAERSDGYHSVPHYHDAEQMNYVTKGSVWFFIDGKGFHGRVGDIVRVPRNAVHWIWVRDAEGCTLFETHTPPLTGDEKLQQAAVSLLAPHEDGTKVIRVRNLWAPVEGMDEIERRAFAEAAQ